MIRFYTPIFLLQAFCLYLAFQRNEGQRWYWIILFFPLIGSLIFLYQTYYNRQNIESFSEGVKSTLNENYKVEKLEREIAFAGTVSNKIVLADEYFNRKNYQAALQVYNSCLEQVYTDDVELLSKLVKVNYQLEDYEAVITHGEKLRDTKTFNSSDEKVAFAWSHYRLGRTEEADELFKEMDLRFSNYTQRLEFAKYMELRGDNSAAKTLLQEMKEEIESMDRYERKMKRKIFQQIKNEYAKH